MCTTPLDTMECACKIALGDEVIRPGIWMRRKRSELGNGGETSMYLIHSMRNSLCRRGSLRVGRLRLGMIYWVNNTLVE